MAFPFPWNGLFSPGNEGFGKKGLLRLEGKFLTFPREGKFTSSHFCFASKDVWGNRGSRGCKRRSATASESSCQESDHISTSFARTQTIFQGYLSLSLQGQNSLGNVNFMSALKYSFGGSLQNLENEKSARNFTA